MQATAATAPPNAPRAPRRRPHLVSVPSAVLEHLPAHVLREMLQSALEQLEEVQERDSRARLKPEFTALMNTFWDEDLYAQLNVGEVRIMLALFRFTNGFQRTECSFGETFLCQRTRLKRTAFYKAKASLIKRGLITVSLVMTQHGERCVYQLSESLQAVLPAQEVPTDEVRPKRANRRTGVYPSAVANPSPSVQADSCKEEQQRHKKQQHLAANAQPAAHVETVVSDDDFEIDHLLEPMEQEWAEAKQPAQAEQLPDLQVDQGSAAPATGQQQAAAPEVARSLARSLEELGVNAFVARRITGQHSQEKIQAAIARTRKVHPANPAAYVVAELQRGGYQDKPDPTKVARQVAEEIHTQRAVERKREAQENEERNARALAPLAPFEQLPVDVQAQIHQRVAELPEAKLFTSRDRHWGPGSPGYEGLLAVVVAEYLGAGEGREAHSPFFHASTG